MTTQITNKESEIINDKITNNKFFFSIQKLIDNVGVKNYKEIKELLLISCTEEQIKQLNEEKDNLTLLIKKAIKANPYKNQDIEQLYGDRYTDFVEGILSKGEDFITKFISFDEKIHKEINLNICNELFGYTIPYNFEAKEIKENKNISRMQKQISDSERYLEELDSCEELSDSYKEKMKIGTQYLIDVGNKFINNKLNQKFDIQTLKSNVFLLSKLEEFSKPIFRKLDLNHGIAHAGWENLIKENLIQKAAINFSEKSNFKQLTELFNDDYIRDYNDSNTEKLNLIEQKYNRQFNDFIHKENNKPKTKKIKP